MIKADTGHMGACDAISSNNAANMVVCIVFCVLLGGRFCTIAFFFWRGWTDVF
jgi:hypothetical protein